VTNVRDLSLSWRGRFKSLCSEDGGNKALRTLVYIHTYIHTYIVHVHTYIYIYIQYIYIHTHTHIYVHIYTQMEFESRYAHDHTFELHVSCQSSVTDVLPLVTGVTDVVNKWQRKQSEYFLLTETRNISRVHGCETRSCA
jgi:hypothetical protein